MALSEKQKAWAAAWRERNREKLRQYYRDWRAKDPERSRAQSRAYYYRHRDKRAAGAEAYRLGPERDAILARQRARYKARYAKRKEAGLCVSCGGGKEGKFVQCLDCRLRAAQLRADKARATLTDGEKRQETED